MKWIIGIAAVMLITHLLMRRGRDDKNRHDDNQD